MSALLKVVMYGMEIQCLPLFTAPMYVHCIEKGSF